VVELFPPLVLTGALTLLGVALAAILLARPAVARGRGGAVLGVVALLFFPLALYWFGMDVHMHHTKETAFCLSCHAMHPYGESLTELEEGMLAAVHFQSRYVPKQEACYTCHTQYTLYGGVQAKIAGVQHVWHNYVAGVSDPIQLYEPYQNRDCLRCHESTPAWRQQPAHQGQLQMMRDEEISCLTCHGPLHGVEEGEVTAAIEGRGEFALPQGVFDGGKP